MKRKGKAVKVAIVALISALAVYFFGGVIATLSVNHIVFDHRGSDESTPSLLQNRIYKGRADYPLLSNSEEHTIEVKNASLHASFFKAKENKGTVVFAHGMNSSIDGPEIAIPNLFVSLGYSVFALDLTASGKSSGQSMENLNQSAQDVSSAYEYLQAKNMVSGPMILAGYSWGGFGVAASLSLGVKADYLITFSAFDCPYDEMVSMAKGKVGDIIYASLPPFAFTTWCAYGRQAFLHASDAVKGSQAKALFIHGENDATVPLSKVSLYQAMEGTDHRFHLSDATHRTPWFSKEARKYVSEEIDPALSNVDSSNKEECDAFIAMVDKEKSSALDAAMVEAIEGLLGE